MHEWRVAGGLIEGPEGLLLVRNRRRSGRSDWTPPGGVIDADDGGALAGLTREVREETGITVTDWHGPVYEVWAVAHDLGWRLHAEVFLAREFEGRLAVDDPDGIVVEAEFAGAARCRELLSECSPWVREPLGEWIDDRWDAEGHRRYEYSVYGTDLASLKVERDA